MKYYFNIADIKLLIESDFEIKWNNYIKSFLSDPFDNYDDYYQCIVVDKLKPTGQLIYQDQFVNIYRKNGHEERLYFFHELDTPSILYKEGNKKIIYLNKMHMNAFICENNYSVFNALAFEKVLIKHKAIVLHCSYIIDNNEAILFTAPSGTGKSTQAALWEKYRNAVIINGDRAIIQKINNQYYARGMPICGSSDICLNKSVPIKTIVYLGQSSENQIRLLSQKEEIKKLMSETTINYFNPQFLNDAFDIIQDISSNIKMYELLCTKDENAIVCLENMLGSE